MKMRVGISVGDMSYIDGRENYKKYNNNFPNNKKLWNSIALLGLHQNTHIFVKKVRKGVRAFWVIKFKIFQVFVQVCFKLDFQGFSSFFEPDLQGF